MKDQQQTVKGIEGWKRAKKSLLEEMIPGHQDVWKMIHKSDPELWREANWDEEMERTFIIHGLYKAERKTYDERRQGVVKEIENIIAVTVEDMNQLTNCQRLG